MTDLFSPTALSVSELNQIAAELLDTQLSALWISGEVSNLTYATSGHIYFSLKDAHAQVRCVLFKQIAQRLDMPPSEGEQIEIKGKVNIYAARGEFQINVNQMRKIGLGQLFERYEQLKQKLQNEGLFSAERKRMLPEYPQRIGIITSPAAAALRDVVSTLHRRAAHIPLIIYPAPVQGSGSEQHIAHAIEQANQRAEVDVLIVCRGGGSLEDLWAFNEEIVARAISGSRVPIVSGVGHETDFTLADFVADVRAPTPTAAAELVSEHTISTRQNIQQYQRRIYELLQQKYAYFAQKVDFLTQNLINPAKKYQLEYQNLMYYRTLLRRIMQNKMAEYQQIAQQNAQLLHTLSPQAMLQRGFAMVRTTRGQVVHHADSLKRGQILTITLAQGTVDVQVLTEQKQGNLFD